MMYGYGDAGWGDWVLMGMTMILMWGFFLALVLWLARSIVGGAGSAHRPSSRPVHLDGLVAQPIERGEVDSDESLRNSNLVHTAVPH